MANGSTAPVCPVSRNQPVANTPRAQQPIVAAVDLPSAIVALNQIATILQKPAPPLPNNLAIPGSPSPAPGSQPAGQRPGWRETQREYDTVRVYNPDDDTYWVELKRVGFIMYEEVKTEVTLDWSL